MRIAPVVFLAATLAAAPAAAAADCYDALRMAFESGHLSGSDSDARDGVVYVDGALWRSMDARQRFRMLECLEEVIAGEGNTFSAFELRSAATGKPVARITMGKPEIVE